MPAGAVARTIAAAWLALACAMIGSGQIPAATLQQANTYLQAGQADKALAILTPLPTSGTGAATAQNLLCRVRYTLADWSNAEKACTLAVQLDGQNSDEHMWLGRVLGQEANHASVFSAYGIAKRSLAEMETAAKLGPQNGPALSDLGDYYAQAPGIAGGGADKAQAIATQLDKVDATRAAQLRGDIAMAQKDDTTAEQQYRKAIASASSAAEYWTVLANLFRERKRWSDFDSAIQSCVAAAAKDKNPGVALYDGAGQLLAAKRNPSVAEQMLQNYLSSSSITEEGPAFIAHIRLSRLKKQLGDAAGANAELATASNMAHEFSPSQDVIK